jgi:NAD(P)-dependent dehydrogenase (short-subunit alcohol dehydrogenase family)
MTEPDRDPAEVRQNATVAVIGAGDYIGAAIARRFAREGYIVFAGRRNGDKLAPLVDEIEAAGGRCFGRALDARQEEAITGFVAEADAIAPLEVAIFNIGANVNFPLLDTTERVFRKVWELACYAGFLTGREAARCMLAHGRGSIFFTGATASMRGGAGYAAFAAAKFGLRAVAQSMARELGPKNLHVAHLVIDAGVDTAWVRDRIRQRAGPEAAAGLELDRLVNPASIAEVYWQLHQQPRDCWTHELDIRPYCEPW